MRLKQQKFHEAEFINRVAFHRKFLSKYEAVMSMYVSGLTFIVQDNDDENNLSFQHLCLCPLEVWVPVCAGTGVRVCSPPHGSSCPYPTGQQIITLLNGTKGRGREKLPSWDIPLISSALGLGIYFTTGSLVHETLDSDRIVSLAFLGLQFADDRSLEFSASVIMRADSS